MKGYNYDFGKWKHTVLGNTWKVTEDGQWYLPKKTLGWDIAAWCHKYLKNDKGEPWTFTLEQLRFVLWWYAVDDSGRFRYRKGVLQRLKGWGKDPLVAAISLVEMVGPAYFSYFDPMTGDPIGASHPTALVTISAVSGSQTRTTTDVYQWMISDELKHDFDMNVGIEKLTAKGGKAQIVLTTSSFRAVEGKRPTLAILNEIQHWVAGKQGPQMYNTINGNVTKSAGGVARMLAITNAYQPGEDSVGETLRQAYFDQVEYDERNPGKRIGPTIYYDSLEADASAPLDPETIFEIVKEVRGDSVWLDPESIVASFLDRSIPISHNRRMFYNQIVAKEDALFAEHEWDACAVIDTLAEGSEIVLGFDGGRTDDATALIAKRVSDGTVFPLAIWEKPQGPAGENWEINVDEVESAVHYAFRAYKPLAFYADVALWESYINQWSDEYRDRLLIKATARSAIGWDMRGGGEKLTRANEALMSDVLNEKFKHNGNRHLRRHALNARRRENSWGLTFGKESRESPLKVDAYAACLLAEMAYRDLKESGATQKRKRSRTLVTY